ncbi:hypothetical protein ZIOFF_044961 [Zingiber officinale]|uniref:VTT domain-containing protein n=1 Tax=Zingiber officinale TaxID=94328 RepID=A0A8J5FW85_ZINOF|nr:hypothetical protein ZIOFF_044961 [Zingiber officinale]
MAVSWFSAVRITLLVLLAVATAAAFFTLPVEKILREFLVWIKQNLGLWGPAMLDDDHPVDLLFPKDWHMDNDPAALFNQDGFEESKLFTRLGVKHCKTILAVAYIPLTILAVPAAVLSLGGGYLFGLPIGFLADSIGGTLGSVAAFLLGRTRAAQTLPIDRPRCIDLDDGVVAAAIAVIDRPAIGHLQQTAAGMAAVEALGRVDGRPYVISKMNDYPDFQAVAVAIERSGFKIVLLLRLAPLIPFCLLNYFLSVTPIGLAEYTMASWLGMMPITLVLVYVGTTLDDLADVTHGWSEASTAHWGTMVAGLVISAILMVCVTREAKAALQKALAENLEAEDILIMSPSPWLPSLLQPSSDLRQPLMIKIET